MQTTPPPPHPPCIRHSPELQCTGTADLICPAGGSSLLGVCTYAYTASCQAGATNLLGKCISTAPSICPSGGKYFLDGALRTLRTRISANRRR